MKSALQRQQWLTCTAAASLAAPVRNRLTDTSDTEACEASCEVEAANAAASDADRGLRQTAKSSTAAAIQAWADTQRGEALSTKLSLYLQLQNTSTQDTVAQCQRTCVQPRFPKQYSGLNGSCCPAQVDPRLGVPRTAYLSTYLPHLQTEPGCWVILLA